MKAPGLLLLKPVLQSKEKVKHFHLIAYFDSIFLNFLIFTNASSNCQAKLTFAIYPWLYWQGRVYSVKF